MVVTCRYNGKVFDSGHLLLDDKCDRWTFKILVYKHFGIVITRCKYIKTYKFVSTKMTKGVGKVTRTKFKGSITVKLPKETIIYQQHMGGIYLGHLHRLIE